MVNCSPHEVCFGFTRGERVQFFKTVLTCKSLDCLCAFTVSEICPRESLPNDPCYPFEKVKICFNLGFNLCGAFRCTKQSINRFTLACPIRSTTCCTTSADPPLNKSSFCPHYSLVSSHPITFTVVLSHPNFWIWIFLYIKSWINKAFSDVFLSEVEP